MKSYTYTHISTEGMTNRQMCNQMIKALNSLTGVCNGTMNEPYEIASMIIDNKKERSLIQVLKEDGEVMYYDGDYCIECDYHHLYVDYSGRAIKEWMEGYERKANDKINN